MGKYCIFFIAIFPMFCNGQSTNITEEELLLERVLADPSNREIKRALQEFKRMDLSPKDVLIHDSITLSNQNRMIVLSHTIDNKRHYGAIVIPNNKSPEKLPIMILATGGDGMHKQFNITQDFNHEAIQFPEFLGGDLDEKFIVVIPSFRGQELIIGDKKYQSEGKVGDAFDGATTDALAFLNVALNTLDMADKKRVGIYGGSRGGTVALLAASRDKRIKTAIVVAAPTDMKQLYLLYPGQFKLLFFNDLLAGNISEQEARAKFIRSSPIYFVDELPMVQLHHDKNDPFVPVKFATELANKMIASSKELQQYYYNEGIHGFWSNPDFWMRVQDSIRQLIE